MLKYQMGIILAKPAVRVKLAIITVLFALSVWVQAPTNAGFAEALGGGGISVAVSTLSLFNYWDFFFRVPLFGFIILLPDIAEDSYMVRHMAMANGRRGRAAGAAVMRIGAATLLYVLWLLLVTVAVSAVLLRDFSAGWPGFFKTMYGTLDQSLFMIPKSATEAFSPLAVLVLVVVRTTLGFMFLAMLAGLVTLATGKSSYAVCLVAVLVLVAMFLNMSAWMPQGTYNMWDTETMAWKSVNLGRFLSVFPLFSFQRLDDNFVSWVSWAIVAGAALTAAMAVGIRIYYGKGDLGDADSDA